MLQFVSSSLQGENIAAERSHHNLTRNSETQAHSNMQVSWRVNGNNLETHTFSGPMPCVELATMAITHLCASQQHLDQP